MSNALHLDNVSIYGYWDDVRDCQFVLVNHPNGIHTDVLMCSGCDYGGGVDYISEGLLVEDVYEVIENHNNPYDAKEAVRSLCKSNGFVKAPIYE